MLHPQMLFTADNCRLACEVELSSTSQASRRSMPTTDIDSTVNVYICINGVPGMYQVVKISLRSLSCSKDHTEDSTEQSAPASPSSSQTKDGLFKEPLVMPDSEPHDENLTEQTHHIIIPSYASWFDYNRYC